MADSAALKAELRAAMTARRDRLDGADRQNWSQALVAHVDTLVRHAPAGAVSGFWPIRSEIDPRPLMLTLHGRGRAIALPCVVDGEIIFRSYAPGDPLVRRGFGLMEPAADAAEVRPALMLVPLLAFDRAGQRLGYGKGYYDRAIARARGAGPLFAAGIAFACQEVEALPVDPWDQALDAILTEAGMRAPRLE